VRKQVPVPVPVLFILQTRHHFHRPFWCLFKIRRKRTGRSHQGKDKLRITGIDLRNSFDSHQFGTLFDEEDILTKIKA
jgi:hypothetical protein